MISYFDSSAILSELLAEREEPDVATRSEKSVNDFPQTC